MKAKKSLGFFAIGGVIALSMAGSAKANSQTINPGDDVDGWYINFNQDQVQLVEDSAGVLTLQIEKSAEFGPGTAGLLISFVPDGSGNSATNIQINDLTLTNTTGFNWTGFQELLENTGGGNATFTNTFDANDVIPWTTSTITTPTEIDFGGGTLFTSPSNPFVAFLGEAAEPNDDINIATTGQEFILKEIPIEATVPVPASVWMGLTGLGVVLLAKKARRVTA